jgi:hypothetical protein
MKNLTKLSLILLISIISFNTYAVTTNPNPPKDEYITVGEFVNLKFKDVKNMSTKKLSIKDRVEFMVTKKMLKKKIKKGEVNAEAKMMTTDQFELNWGGFALGFLLGLLGLIIVAIFFKKPKKNAVVSSLIGMVAITALYLIFA